MGFSNPDISWGELERRLSGRPHDGRLVDPLAGDGSDSPAWSRKRAPYVPPTPVAAPGECPTPNCTATRTSRSSTGRHTPRSWPKRPPGSVWKPSPSPTTTASTAWCGSPRRPERSICPIFGAELTLAEPGRALKRPGPADLPGVTSSSRNPVATPCSVARSAKANWQGRRGARIHERLVELGGQGTGDHWAVLTACRKARCRLRS